MSSDDRFSFVLAAVLAATVLLGVSQMRRPVVGGPPDPPRAGRNAAELTVGPTRGDALEPVAAGPDAEAALAEERVQSLLRQRGWPEFARSVVFHPLVGPELAPPGVEEQGPLYHVVVHDDGSLRWTQRGEAGAPGQPTGLPVHEAIRALHVAIPSGDQAGNGRLASVRALWSEAARQFGEAAVLFADEVPGSAVSLPAGFERSAWIAPQQTRGPQTRPRGAASQPASRPGRLRLGLGPITVQAGVATTFDSRTAGLSGRKSLDKNEGLLFVYHSPDTRSFWMKDCLIPLDIIYLKDDGEVISVTTAPPADPKIPEAELPRYPSAAPCRLVLEVAGGLAAKAGVRAGSKVALPESVAGLFEKADP